MIELTIADKGTTINAAVGDEVRITLTWNPSSGFFWRSVNTSAGVLEEMLHEGDSKPGAPVLVHFKFKITGTGDLGLHYARPILARSFAPKGRCCAPHAPFPRIGP